jgi:hypothetical protein
MVCDGEAFGRAGSRETGHLFLVPREEGGEEPGSTPGCVGAGGREPKSRKS